MLNILPLIGLLTLTILNSNEVEARTVCLRNLKYNAYFYAGGDQYARDNYRRTQFLWTPGITLVK
jgi:hypothetical protein